MLHCRTDGNVNSVTVKNFSYIICYLYWQNDVDLPASPKTLLGKIERMQNELSSFLQFSDPVTPGSPCR